LADEVLAGFFLLSVLVAVVFAFAGTAAFLSDFSGEVSFLAIFLLLPKIERNLVLYPILRLLSMCKRQLEVLFSGVPTA